MTRYSSHFRRSALMACVLLLAIACGGDGGDGDDGDSTAADGVEEASPSTDDSPESTASGDGGSGDAPSASTASGSVTVDGVTYEFSDVTECEVGGDFGPEWRSFVAFDEGGHNFVHITHAAAPDDWMTSFDLSIGLQNARTLDEGNPDQEWTTGMGGSLAVTLTDAGAEGTAEVTDLDVAGAVDATATWSFSC